MMLSTRAGSKDILFRELINSIIRMFVSEIGYTELDCGCLYSTYTLNGRTTCHFCERVNSVLSGEVKLRNYPTWLKMKKTVGVPGARKIIPVAERKSVGRPKKVKGSGEV